MPMWLQAWAWGTTGGAARVLGCATAWIWRIPSKVLSSVMSFGTGVLISALSFQLVEKAFNGGGLLPTVGGFLSGVAGYAGANALLVRKGAKHRKRSDGKQPAEKEAPGSGTEIAEDSPAPQA